VFGIPKEETRIVIRFKQNAGNGRSLVGEVHVNVWDAISSVAEELVVEVKEGLLLKEKEKEKEASRERMDRGGKERERERTVELVEESPKPNKKKNQKRTVPRRKQTVYPARPPTENSMFPIYLRT
jgi:hypothetical protein